MQFAETQETVQSAPFAKQHICAPAAALFFSSYTCIPIRRKKGRLILMAELLWEIGYVKCE